MSKNPDEVHGIKLRDSEIELLEKGEIIEIPIELMDGKKLSLGIGYARHRGEESEDSPISVRD